MDINMNIAYSINDKYVGYCLVSICSLLANNNGRDVTIHILYEELQEGSIKRISEFVNNKGGKIAFHRIKESSVEGLILANWPKSAWYRVFLPIILGQEIDRVLYLDSDTVISGPISELFDMDLNGHSLAGCLDIMTLEDEIFHRLEYPKESGYICSGVLMMNLDYFRKNDLTFKIMSYARENATKLKYPDQDAINYVCHDSKSLLPLKFETMNSYFRNDAFIAAHRNEFAGMIEDPRIIHYAGCPPWFIETNTHIYSNLFWKYARDVGGVKLLHFSKGITIPKNIVKFLLGKIGVARYSSHCKINLKKFIIENNISIQKRQT